MSYYVKEALGDQRMVHPFAVRPSSAASGSSSLVPALLIGGVAIAAFLLLRKKKGTAPAPATP